MAPFAPAQLRVEPYRLFFPLGALLGVAGVAAWLPFASGAGGPYVGLYHAVTQSQAFLLAFAVGFLLTAVPKRTGSAPAGWAHIGGLAALVCAVPIATAFGQIALGQAAYVAALAVLAAFAVRRFLGRDARRRPPASFVLVPMGLVAGISGASLLAAGSSPGGSLFALALGRALAFEGVFTCLVLGIGSFFLPLALRGVAARDLDASWRSRLAALGYAAAGVATFVGLLVEVRGAIREGLLLRACAAVAVLVAAGTWRRPSRPGLNRRVLWCAPWTLPLGLLLAAGFPEHRTAAMHVAFVGGFGLLALCVATHVALGHAGLRLEQEGRPWPIAAFAALLALAMVMRALATVLVVHYLLLLLLAALAWLFGLAVWTAYLGPKMARAPLAASEDAP